jgi:hypothetical protein
MSSNNVEFNLAKDVYASFDAITLKEYIKERLTENSLFTDQNFEGSNLSALTDIFAFTYHILLFYLNQTSSEAMFDQAQLYENINKLVKLIGYNPEGPKTSILSFNATGNSDLPVGAYGIRRYSFINYNGYQYSFRNDIAFEKTVSGEELLSNLSENNLLYQGSFTEYPDYVATGENYETVIVALEDTNDEETTQFVDYNSTDVYIKNISTGEWEQWEEIESLYYAQPTSKVYEKRINENGRIEIKFGNSITGKKLSEGDIVSIFYILSDGAAASVDAGALPPTTSIFSYNSDRFQEISGFLYATSDGDNIIGDTVNSGGITLSNPSNSAPYSDYELASDIKQNAPRVFAAQRRAVTVSDYIALIEKNFGNLFQSVQVVNNSRYIDNVIKYYYDIGLSRPNEDNNILISQLEFADACDFNNVYIYLLPTSGLIINETDPIPLPQSIKRIVAEYLNEVKMITNEVVINDPVQIAFDLGVEIQANDPRSIDDIRSNSEIVIEVDRGTSVSVEDIKLRVNDLITNYFDRSNVKLGMTVSLLDISRNILDLNGVKNIVTRTTYEGVEYTTPGLSFVFWNALYPDSDINITTQNINLEFFKVPFLYEKSKLISKIKVQ